MVWTCLPFIRSGQNQLARHSERGEKTRDTEEKKGWDENIKEWTGLEYAKSKRAVENRKKTWMKLVVKSPVVLQRSSWLRAR